MAVNYTNLFTALGEFVQRAHRYVGLYAGIDTDQSEIESDLNSVGLLDIFSGMPEEFDGFKSSILSWISTVNSRAQLVLQDRETVLEELNLVEADLATVLLTMYRDMVDQAKTINRSTVTIGAVTDDKANSGAGSILVDKLLDGTTSPGANMAANWEYSGVNSELAGSEEMFVQVISDSESDGESEGNETLQVFGNVSSGDAFSWENFGSGTGATFKPIQGGSMGSNFEFEAFSSNVPDSWTITGGAAGVNVFEETTIVHRGDSALKLIGDGGTVTVSVSQDIDASAKPRTKYCVGFWVRGNASLASGVLTIQFEGTGYTAGASEKISLNTAALVALPAYTWKYFYVTMPDEIPDDMKLVIKFNNTPSAHGIYVDGGGMILPVWHNGVSFVAYAGSEAFIKTDKFVLNVTNDDVGVFQKWFRKALGVQMPSSGAPNIADALAT
jgi:hypothetical protein